MKYISPILIEQFNRNELPAAQMKKLEADLIKNRVADAAILMLRQEYHTRTDIADLIGDDDEECSLEAEKEKIFQKECEKNNSSVSFGVNNKIQQNMKKMNITKEEMEKVAERYNNIKNESNTSLSLKENLVACYLSQNPVATHEQAEEIVTKLINGCNELTRKYNKALSEGTDFEFQIIEITKRMEVADRFNYLLNLLSVVETLNLSAFDTTGDIKDAVVKFHEQYAASRTNPTAADCEEILKLIVEAISNNTLILSGAEKVQDLLKGAGTPIYAINFADEQFDDAKMKAEMALAMWLEYEQGNIPSIPENALPETIGIGAATSVEESKVMNDVANGTKTADMAVKCLKILGGVALFLLLGYSGIIISAALGTLALGGLMTIFGTSTIACIASMVICIPLFWGMAQFAVKAGAYIMEKAGKVFDFVVDKLRKTIFPRIKAVATKFIEWVKSKLDGNTSGHVAVIPVINS